jgi:hypothetical protein
VPRHGERTARSPGRSARRRRCALWNGQTQLFDALILHAVSFCRTAFEVSQASQKIVLDAEELALANHKILSRSRRLPDMIARTRRIVTESQDKSGGPGRVALGSCHRARSHSALSQRVEARERRQGDPRYRFARSRKSAVAAWTKGT